MGSQHLYEKCLFGPRETIPGPRYAASKQREGSGLLVAPARPKTRPSEGLAPCGGALRDHWLQNPQGAWTAMRFAGFTNSCGEPLIRVEETSVSSNSSTRISDLATWPASGIRPSGSVGAASFILSIPSDSDEPRRSQPCFLRVREDSDVTHFKRFLIHLSVPPPSFPRLASLPPRPIRSAPATPGCFLAPLQHGREEPPHQVP